MQIISKIQIWFLSAILSSFVLSIPVFAVETSIPGNVNVYSWVFRQLDRTDVSNILAGGQEEASIKTLAQNAFERFKQDEYLRDKSEEQKSQLALEQLRTLVDDLYNEKEHRTSRIRIRLIESALDGVGDDNVRWFG